MKLVGSDLGNYARETWVESVVIAPAERYVVDVRFERAGEVAMVNRVRAIDHLYARFFDEVDTLGAVTVAGDAGDARSRAAVRDAPADAARRDRARLARGGARGQAAGAHARAARARSPASRSSPSG